MTICGFTTSYWRDAAHATEKQAGLERWCRRMKFWFEPKKLFIATAADSSLCPVSSQVTIINSGTQQTKGYDPISWCYYLCDLEAMLRASLEIYEWDFLIELETDWVVRDMNRHVLLTQFMWKDELICCPAWMGACENSFIVWKRAGVHKFLANRKRPNLSDTPLTMTAESELKEIFGDEWWNPWPGIPTMRQEYNVGHNQFIEDDVARTWPLVGRPSPIIKDESNKLMI